MKKIILFCLLASFALAANAQNLNAYMSYATFKVPGGEPYIETYLAVDGSTVMYEKIGDSSYRAIVELTMCFYQDDVLKEFSKINLESPIVKDSSKLSNFFMDQQRIVLPNGTYKFEITMKDLIDTNSIPIVVTETLVINLEEKEALSGIQLVEKYERSTKRSILTKNNYDLYPYVSTVYPANIKELIFYAEAYNFDTASNENIDYRAISFIRHHENHTIINSLSKVTDISGDISVLFSSFNIENLPSGNYDLVIEIKNSKNQLVAANSVFFHRVNPDVEYSEEYVNSLVLDNTFVSYIDDRDSLVKYLSCLAPICSETERRYADNLIGAGNITNMQKYLLNFWTVRSPQDPKHSWEIYYGNVLAVDREFGTSIKEGFETDRGIIYLKYGSPNTMAERDEPTSYPYEIWHYYVVGSYRDVKFVFYNPDIISNDFTLLHSNMAGEIYNYNWLYDIYSRTTAPNDYINASSEVQEHYGGEAQDLYDNPR